MANLHVSVSPITNTIYAGYVLKDGRTWGSNKTDVTNEAIGSVARHIEVIGEPITVNLNGTPKYKITVEVLNDK